MSFLHGSDSSRLAESNASCATAKTRSPVPSAPLSPAFSERSRHQLSKCSSRVVVSPSSVQALYSLTDQIDVWTALGWTREQSWCPTLQNSLRPHQQEMSRVIAPIRGIWLDAHRGHHLTVVGSKLRCCRTHTHSPSTSHHSQSAPPRGLSSFV